MLLGAAGWGVGVRAAPGWLLDAGWCGWWLVLLAGGRTAGWVVAVLLGDAGSSGDYCDLELAVEEAATADIKSNYFHLTWH